LNDNVEDVKHNDKDGTNLALDIENDIENDTDTDTTTTTAQNHIVDKVVAATHSADHTMVSSEKQEGVTDLDFYRNQAYDLVKKIAFKLNLDNTVVKINHGCGFLLVDTVDKSNNNFEDWGVWWLLLGYSANISTNGCIPDNCPTITSNSFSNSNGFRVLLYKNCLQT
jgi:hypothetical protein